MVIIPKISFRHQQIIVYDDDYILGNICSLSLDDIMFYNEYKKQNDKLDKTNDLEINGFAFLKDILNNGSYYVYSNKLYHKNTVLCSILYCISQYFALLKTKEQVDRFIQDFRIQMAIDIVEKGYYKSLNLAANKIKRKLIEEILLVAPDAKPKEDSDEILEYNIDKIISNQQEQLLKYICLRFNIGLTVIYSDKSFKEIRSIPNRLNIILLANDDKYSVLCSKDNSNYLHSSKVLDDIITGLKKLVPKLKSVKEYTVADLKELAKQYSISITGLKKDEIYNKLVSSLN